MDEAEWERKAAELLLSVPVVDSGLIALRCPGMTAALDPIFGHDAANFLR
jgi:hypothetical protein